MRKSARRIVGQCVGISLSASAAVVGTIVIRHILETPQPLKSSLPGEALLYPWQKRSIFYKVLGEKNAPPLLLLHTPEIGASAYEMQALMEPLAQTYRVYAPDLLGFGLSDKPGIEYSARLYSEFCQDFLRDIIQQPATLLASGLSCNYAISTAASQPELCTALILISPLALHGEEQRPTLITNLIEKPLLKMLLYPLVSTRLGFTLARGRQQARQQDFTHFYTTTHQLGAKHAAMALLAGKLSKHSEQEFETLQQPVLMIWGTQALEEQRYLACLRDTTQQRQARQVELIQGAGLAVHQEQPESVISAVKRWQTETPLLLPAEAETRGQTIAAALQTETVKQIVSTRGKSAPLLQEKAAQAPHISTTNALPAETSTASTAPTPSAKMSSTPEIALPESKHEQTENTSQRGSIQAYCVKCKKKTEMLNPSRFTMKNGRAATRGKCAVCGSGTTRIGELSGELSQE